MSASIPEYTQTSVRVAKQAGVTAVWARYGTRYDPACWVDLVKITHWTDEDVIREKDLKAKYGGVVPDYVIDSFAELTPIVLAKTDQRAKSA